MSHRNLARQIFDLEIEGLMAVRDSLGEAFEQLVELCLKTRAQQGKLVLTGVGKSGHIGHKIAATLSSTGSPAVFMHPVEAMHGDLGVVSPDHDILICISYSGETDELLAVLPAAKRFGVPMVAITGKDASSLAEWCDLVIPMEVPKEACPFNLAPTTSTTTLLALGDALAIVMMKATGFTQEDYGSRHPSGAIGRSITLRVQDVMRGPDRTPVVTSDTIVKEALMAMTKCRSGSVLIVDDDKKLLGIFTDGDFRRHAFDDLDVMHAAIGTVMTKDPIRMKTSQMAIEMMNLLESREINDIPVVDEDDRVAGLVDIQDMPKFKLM